MGGNLVEACMNAQFPIFLGRQHVSLSSRCWVAPLIDEGSERLISTDLSAHPSAIGSTNIRGALVETFPTATWMR